MLSGAGTANMAELPEADIDMHCAVQFDIMTTIGQHDTQHGCTHMVLHTQPACRS